ncbi:calcium/sodium antiporter [Erythrobacteraceae bacterium CFH 75059]|uniref:calcium/sodium antiporter n=1 Tax=Qipengyuania thermophila TaxID=2509361 RepID=UPI00102195A2|nr:calcium/sodium antiporter [Qipengyuania thermophila]TCD06898.1 calcium/sodium antiporter [Erythrobacteraceae bacterium CFH 75059]
MLLSLLAGLALLAAGGELLVRGSVGLAQRLGVSPLLAGLVIVGFGTSTPELSTSVQAALGGAPGIAIGNVVGSNIANILLILGVSALILPLAVDRTAFRRDSLALAGSTLLCAAAVLAGTIGRTSGAVLLAGLAAYVVWAYRSERRGDDAERRRHETEAADANVRARNALLLALMVVAGLAAAIFGARLLVDAAVTLAGRLGVSETVIGLTVVAVGTSLPELIACLVAVARKHADVALGNIVGSNIYNVLGILGLTAVIQPMTVPAELARFDVWVLLGVTALLLVQLRSGWRVSRTEGALLCALFAGYTAFLILR